MENKKTIDDLAIELFEIYTNSEKTQPFNAGIEYANHSHHLKEIINMKSLSKIFKIEAIYFDPKDMRKDFSISRSRYESHEIKDGELRVNLTGNYKRSFSLE